MHPSRWAHCARKTGRFDQPALRRLLARASSRGSKVAGGELTANTFVPSPSTLRVV